MINSTPSNEEKIDSLTYLLKSIPLVTFLIIFLYVVGTIYLLCFWGLFNIEVLNFVSIADIPKYAVKPLIYSQIPFACYVYFSGDFSERKYLPHTDPKIEAERIRRAISKRSIFLTILSGMVALGYITIIVRNTQYFIAWFWIIVMVLCMIFAIDSAFNSTLKYSLFTNRLIGQYSFLTILLAPIFSICLARAEAISVYNNKDIQYYSANTKEKDADTKAKDTSASINHDKFKLIGFAGDKVVISTFDNVEIRVLNQSELTFSRLIDSTNIRTK